MQLHYKSLNYCILTQGTYMKLLLPVLLLLSTAVFADTSSDIEKAIRGNLEHTENEDVDAVMRDLHSLSPAYSQTQQVLLQLFSAYDLEYELVDYSFVGEDEEYAYAKVKQRTSKVSGPAFQDNEIDMLVIFKQENGVWKLWTQANLAVSYL